MSDSLAALLPGEARAWGAFYTPPEIARYLAHQLVRDSREVVLEPACGDGVFLDAVNHRLAAIGDDDAEVWGFEIREEAIRALHEMGAQDRARIVHGDFLASEPFPVDVVLGNPPYVRLRDLPEDMRTQALAAVRIGGVDLEPSGSSWAPFIVHAMRFLRRGGRLGFVLPFEVTHVRYARRIWQHLGKHFASLRVVYVWERLFTGIYQRVVLLLADGYGGQTNTVRFVTASTMADLWHGATQERSIEIVSILEGKKAFIYSMLPISVVGVLDSLRSREIVAPIGDVADVTIGYVSGDKTFFHPSSDVRARFSLPDEHLIPALVSTRQLRSMGLFTENVAPDTYLYAPRRLTPSDLRYISHGEATGVHEHYKCAVRDPWYMVPQTTLVPEVIFSVFADVPLAVLNNARLLASNSLLIGRTKNGLTAKGLVANWYSTVTMLTLEAEVHSLGGGVMVLIPGEIRRALIPRLETQGVDTLMQRIQKELLRGRFDNARIVADEAILRDVLRLSSSEILALEEGLSLLRDLRNDRLNGPMDAVDNLGSAG